MDPVEPTADELLTYLVEGDPDDDVFIFTPKVDTSA